MTGKSRRRALLIGVSRYEDDNFHDVPAAVNSLHGVERMLKDPALCGWSEDSVVVIKNPKTPRELRKPLRQLVSDASDTLLLYFVGHGTLNAKGSLCLLLSETESDDIRFSALEYNLLREILAEESSASTKIVILDCCYSGKAIEALSADTEIATKTSIGGAYTLTASDWEAHVPNSLHTDARTSFTDALIETVSSGISDAGEFLDFSRIYGQLSYKLSSKGMPRPNQRGTDNVTNFAFSRNPAFVSALPTGRTVEQQLPDDPVGVAMLEVFERWFERRESEFIHAAVAIWKLIEPSTGQYRVLAPRRGVEPVVEGKFLLGPIDDRIALDFVLTGTGCTKRVGVGQAIINRLLGRVRNMHFGVIVTLGYIEENVYRTLRSDGDPIVVVTGGDIIEALRVHGCQTVEEVEEWLRNLTRPV